MKKKKKSFSLIGWARKDKRIVYTRKSEYYTSVEWIVLDDVTTKSEKEFVYGRNQKEPFLPRRKVRITIEEL